MAIGVHSRRHSDRGGMTRNISPGGVLFHSAWSFEIGEEVALVFRIAPDRPELHATGRVVRTDRDDPARAAALPYFTAVQFHERLDALL